MSTNRRLFALLFLRLCVILHVVAACQLADVEHHHIDTEAIQKHVAHIFHDLFYVLQNAWAGNLWEDVNTNSY